MVTTYRKSEKDIHPHLHTQAQDKQKGEIEWEESG